MTCRASRCSVAGFDRVLGTGNWVADLTAFQKTRTPSTKYRFRRGRRARDLSRV